ncbi:hypothetical protein [Mucilaginibacter sp. SP1R1]|uniref:hypothetical protein n=1 Tax=Mucilaginibacter sp. SP1R1 TaxID=2723091 RepID=UPI00161B907F|nr:hypothetical protein [Mucilaginibacter sp. SP1R1]MBB6149480.1 hypothetical protein [Mucilaginibacter sp. SP1R1]
MKIFLIILIALCQVAITIIPSKYAISDNRHNFPKNFTKWGWGLIAVCVVTMGASIWIFIIGDHEQSDAQETLKTELRSRDSIHEKSIVKLSHNYTVKVDSSYKKSEETFIAVTAKYGLHYDSVSKKLENKIDTAKVEMQPDVALNKSNGIELDSTVNNSYYFRYNLAAYDAAAKNINMALIFFGMHKDGKIAIVKDKDPKYPRNLHLSKDQVLSYGVTINSTDIKALYIYLHGTYTNIGGNKLHRVDEIYSYEIGAKPFSFGAPNGAISENIRSLINNKK